MSFGLPLHDRILKWQLVSRVDSVRPVRGKKSETRAQHQWYLWGRWWKNGMALPERRVSSSRFPKQLEPGSLASSDSKCTLTIGSCFLSTTTCPALSRPFMRRRFHPFFFLLKLKTLWSGDRWWFCFLPRQKKGKCRMELWGGNT